MKKTLLQEEVEKELASLRGWLEIEDDEFDHYGTQIRLLEKILERSGIEIP